MHLNVVLLVTTVYYGDSENANAAAQTNSAAIYEGWGWAMDTARLFQSGRSQAVRLPKEYRFEGTGAAVRHFGNGVLLLPFNEPWAMLDAALEAFEPGFQISRDQPATQVREEIAS